MTQIVFSTNQNGTGTFTVETPVSDTNRVISLPDINGAILVDSQIATQEEAIAGTDNTKIMTALRVAQLAINIPSGGIILWYGSVESIPAGWALCDGNNGTPDLRDRFVVGAGSSNYAVGATGGSATVSLTAAELPSHTHSLTTGEAASHSHSITSVFNAGTGSAAGMVYSAAGQPYPDQATNATTTALTGSSGATGTGSAHENRPPYYALCYIMNLI